MRSFSDLQKWASGVLAEDYRRFTVTSDRRKEFLLMQVAKLGEEVGELNAEVIAVTGYQFREKGKAHGPDSMQEELADVAIALAFLAEALGVDLSGAVARKIAARHTRPSGAV